MKIPPAYDVHPPQQGISGPHYVNSANPHLYPSLMDFMGLEITPEMLSANNLPLAQPKSVKLSYLYSSGKVFVSFLDFFF